MRQSFAQVFLWEVRPVQECFSPLNSERNDIMKKSLYNRNEYLITAAFNAVSLILWLLPVFSFLGLTEYTLSEIAENMDIAIFNIFGILYVLLAIAGLVVALLPAIKEMASVQAIPDIKDGLFIYLQGAPLIHAVLLLFWYAYINAELGRLAKIQFTGGGIIALLVGIAGGVWYCILNARYKKNKKAQKNSTAANL